MYAGQSSCAVESSAEPKGRADRSPEGPPGLSRATGLGSRGAAWAARAPAQGELGPAAPGCLSQPLPTPVLILTQGPVQGCSTPVVAESRKGGLGWAGLGWDLCLAGSLVEGLHVESQQPYTGPGSAGIPSPLREHPTCTTNSPTSKLS